MPTGRSAFRFRSQETRRGLSSSTLTVTDRFVVHRLAPALVAGPLTARHDFPPFLQNASPRLSDDSHKALVATLRTLAAEAEIHLINIAALSQAERVALLSRTRILLGARHEIEFVLATLWMKGGEGTVLEMFAEPSIVRDNAVSSSNRLLSLHTSN